MGPAPIELTPLQSPWRRALYPQESPTCSGVHFMSVEIAATAPFKPRFGIKPIWPYLADPIRGPAIIARFWSNVARRGEGECWDWTACRGGKGLYGQTTVGGGRIRRSNRVASAIVNGEDPGERVIRHTCDRAICCNPAHLVAGTHEENMTDMVVRGRTVGKPPLRASMTKAALCARNERLLSALNQIAASDSTARRRALQEIAAASNSVRHAGRGHSIHIPGLLRAVSSNPIKFAPRCSRIADARGHEGARRSH